MAVRYLSKTPIPGIVLLSNTCEASFTDIPMVEPLPHLYRDVLSAFLATPSAIGRFRVELMSKEILVAWSLYCLVHQVTGKEWRFLERYNIPLDPSLFPHLSLGG